MMRVREFCAFGLSLGFLFVPVSNAATPEFGTVTTAQAAHVGTAAAFVGSTVFGGDKLSTEADGALQIRAGAARFLLSRASAAQLGDRGGTPSATLYSGTALFSTANADAFVLRASNAEIWPQTDAPTVGQVSIVNAKELLVLCKRGALMVSVGGETQIIPAESAYRVMLAPETASGPEPGQGPRGAGAGGQGRPPIFTGRSNFVKVAIGVTAVLTFFAVDEALESPDRP
jgi:hypothetical protein